MMTANEWIRNQAAWDRAFEQHAKIVADLTTNAFLNRSTVYNLILAIDLRDKAERLNIGGQVMQAEGLINARARDARSRILSHAFRQLCEVWS